jgi:twinkle protein
MSETRFITDWSEIGITGLKAGENNKICPSCASDRKKKNSPTLCVNTDKGVSLCQHCGIKYIISKKKEKEYVKPEWKNNTLLSDKLIKWFETRGISQETLVKAKLSEGKKSFNGTEFSCIEFNYFRNNELFNVKYRNAAKNFQLFPKGELNFYNLDSIKNQNECIIVEGEMDCLAFIESTRFNVVSVPNGANLKSNNLGYFETSYHYFEDKDKIYIAVDNDEAGINLKNDLIIRLNPEKCYLVDFKDCKDANEYLLKYGKTELYLTIDNAKRVPISNVVTIDDIDTEIDDLYINGLKKGLLIGQNNLDDHISFESGRLTTITGIPAHGKSEFLDFLAESLAIRYNLKFGIYSPENSPVSIHFSKLAEKVIGRPFSGNNKMNLTELGMAKDFINNHFYFITPDENFSLESILDKAKKLILRYGINALIIDPWNKVQKDNVGETETLKVQEMLNELSAFKRVYNLHIFVIAHPKKMTKQKGESKYDVPTLYDISGTSEFYNQTDYGITVYRDWDLGKIEIHIQKVKFKHLGHDGMVELAYNINNGRFSEWNYGSPNWDNSNHLIKEQEQIEVFTEDINYIEIKPKYEKFTPEVKSLPDPDVPF